MSYCTIDDVTPLLGDLEFSSSFDPSPYITKAAADMDLTLGRRYVVPVLSNDYYTNTLLLTVNAELAASQVLMSLAQGGEDNRVNAYAMHLYKRAIERLSPYYTDLVLPGSTLLEGMENLATGPAAIYQEDSESPLTNYYRAMSDPWYSPRLWPSDNRG